MHNRDGELSTRSIHGVMKNIAYLRQRNPRKTLDNDGQQSSALTRQPSSAYQGHLAADIVKGEPVVTPIYKYNTHGAYYRHLFYWLSYALCGRH